MRGYDLRDAIPSVEEHGRLRTIAGLTDALPKGRVVHIANAGHFVHVEHPGELAKIVVPQA